MEYKDYGLLVQRMRKSRGYTQEELAELSGVSSSTIRKLESSGYIVSMRDNNLDAILTALAQRAPLGGSEIQVLVHATGRLFESFESLNDRAEQLRRAAMAGPSARIPTEPTTEDRINHAISQLLAAGMGEPVLVQLEALAAMYGDQIASESRQRPASESRPKRQLRVRHPERRVKDLVIEEISNYEIDDDDQPIAKRPVRDPDERPLPDEDSDTINNTG